MRRRWDIAAVLAILVWSASASAAVLSDTNAPQLKSFQFSPATLDTSTNDQVITITARATDDLSGLTAGYDQFGRPRPGVLNVVFASPIANSGAYVYATLRTPSVLPFTPLDVTWTGQLRVPRYSHVGTWTLEEIGADDAVGNAGQFSASDVRALGFPTTFKVTGIEDRTPPELLTLTVETNKIETSPARKEVKFKGRIREELSGFGSFDEFGRPLLSTLFLGLVGPSKMEIQGRAFVGGSNPLGIDFEGSVDLPPYCPPGVWRLEWVSCSDNAGNRMPRIVADEFAQSFAIEVTGHGDTNAPQLRALSFSPRRIDTSTNLQTVAVRARAVDDLSGLFSSGTFTIFANASATFQSPSKRQEVSVFFFAGGDPFDAALTNSLYFPQYSETGVWTLRSFGLGDVAGNRVGYENSDLQQLGLPTEIAVGITPQLSIDRQGNSVLFSWPAWASDMAVEISDSVSAAQWQRSQSAPTIIGEKCVLLITPASGQQFYRLAATD
jgi:hypothetical protein